MNIEKTISDWVEETLKRKRGEGRRAATHIVIQGDWVNQDEHDERRRREDVQTLHAEISDLLGVEPLKFDDQAPIHAVNLFIINVGPSHLSQGTFGSIKQLQLKPSSTLSVSFGSIPDFMDIMVRVAEKFDLGLRVYGAHLANKAHFLTVMRQMLIDRGGVKPRHYKFPSGYVKALVS